MILLDTDHFSVLTDDRHSLYSQLVERIEEANEQFAVSVVGVEEQLRAWLAQIHRVRDVHKLVEPYERLVELLGLLSEWDIVKWSERAADEFADLRSQRIRIGTQDLKIAALALAYDATLLTANLQDFEKVPGLRVEDWLYG